MEQYVVPTNLNILNGTADFTNNGYMEDGIAPELDKKLTAKGRKRIKASNFALPGKRYPIHDPSHARNALARVSQYGSPSEKARVRAAVYRKYPGMKKSKSKR